MKKQELRPCIVDIPGEYESMRYVGLGIDPTEIHTKCTRGPEHHKGWFHRWIKNQFSFDSCTGVESFGLVEYEDGSVHKVDPECITFMDRCKPDTHIEVEDIFDAIEN